MDVYKEYIRLKNCSINNLVKEAHDTAVKKGWYNEPKTYGDIIALMHSELSESFEFERNKNASIWLNGRINYKHHYSGNGYVGDQPSENSNKPDGSLVELADVVIRIFDYVGSLEGVDFEAIIMEKMEYNKTRSHKHGGKVL